MQAHAAYVVVTASTVLPGYQRRRDDDHVIQCMRSHCEG